VLTRGEIIRTRVYDLPSIGEPRSLLRATVRIEGATMDVYVTHLAAWGKFARKNRENQLRCILGIVAPSPNPWLLMGDFNADSDSPEMQPLLYGGAIHTSGDVERASHKITGERLDYLFADPGWDTMSSAVLSVDPSDHRPVISELRHGGAQ
jgi:endonuclease/exonuclease/phosphatase family metal-dependent hydrolase